MKDIQIKASYVEGETLGIWKKEIQCGIKKSPA
jgi:hypothetical protein